MKIDGTELADGGGVGAVHARLREAILSGELQPGEPISQVKLAQEMGVSRTPLREAIRMLQREGLLEGEPNKRIVVAPFSVEDMEELYALRITVEALGVRLTVPLLSEEELATLDGRLAQMAYFAEREDYERYSVPHAEFHAGLTAKSGVRIVTLLAQLSDHCERYRRLHTTQAPHAWEQGAREHREILDAYIARDADTAAVRLAEHLAHTTLDNLALLEAGREPVSLQRALDAIRASRGVAHE
jgi:GntR family transcriptional regulator, rspAB operon transcriptional repressor